MYNNDKINISKEFVKVVGKILKQKYSLVKEIKITKTNIPDFMTTNGIWIEVKYLTNNNINNVINILRNYLSHNNEIKEKIVFVINFSKDSFYSNTISKLYYSSNINNQINIIFIENLLYLCDDDELKTNLIQCLDYSTENIVPQDLDNNIKAIKAEIITKFFIFFNSLKLFNQ